MKALTYIEKGRFALTHKPKLVILEELDTEPLLTHSYPLEQIMEAYELFEQRRDGVIKIAVTV